MKALVVLIHWKLPSWSCFDTLKVCCFWAISSHEETKRSPLVMKHICTHSILSRLYIIWKLKEWGDVTFDNIEGMTICIAACCTLCAWAFRASMTDCLWSPFSFKLPLSYHYLMTCQTRILIQNLHKSCTKNASEVGDYTLYLKHVPKICGLLRQNQCNFCTSSTGV